MFQDQAIKDAVESGPQILVYFLIDQIGAFTWRMNHDMGHGRIPQEDHAAINKDIVRAQGQQVELVKCLHRFGVEQPLDENGRPSDDYWKWYKWWSHWHKDELSDEQWRKISVIDFSEHVGEEVLAECRPEGSWNA